MNEDTYVWNCFNALVLEILVHHGEEGQKNHKSNNMLTLRRVQNTEEFIQSVKWAEIKVSSYFFLQVCSPFINDILFRIIHWLGQITIMILMFQSVLEKTSQKHTESFFLTIIYSFLSQKMFKIQLTYQSLPLF